MEFVARGRRRARAIELTLLLCALSVLVGCVRWGFDAEAGGDGGFGLGDGGGWGALPGRLRAAYRGFWPPGDTENYFGFRWVRRR